jgi:hypothetical protein
MKNDFIIFSVPLIIFLLVGVLFIIYYFKESKRIGSIKLSSLGGRAPSTPLVDPNLSLKKILIKNYIIQQSWSCRILCFSILGCLLLGFYLVYINSKTPSNSYTFSQICNFAGGSVFSISSFKFYKMTSSRIEDLLKKK